MSLGRGDVEEINRVLGNVFQKIAAINKRMDTIEAQMGITCFNITLCVDWQSGVGEELYLNINRTADLAAIYIAGQFVFMHDNRIASQLRFCQVIKNKYIFRVSANQKELLLELMEITDKIAPDSIISPDGNVLKSDGETMHDALEPASEIIAWATFPIKEFFEASDAQKHHLNMKNQQSHLDREAFYLYEDESYSYPDCYQFKSKNFFIWINKDQPQQNLNTPYQQAVEGNGCEGK